MKTANHPLDIAYYEKLIIEEHLLYKPQDLHLKMALDALYLMKKAEAFQFLPERNIITEQNAKTLELEIGILVNSIKELKDPIVNALTQINHTRSFLHLVQYCITKAHIPDYNPFKQPDPYANVSLSSDEWDATCLIATRLGLKPLKTRLFESERGVYAFSPFTNDSHAKQIALLFNVNLVVTSISVKAAIGCFDHLGVELPINTDLKALKRQAICLCALKYIKNVQEIPLT
jgi:hypothetical protein